MDVARLCEESRRKPVWKLGETLRFVGAFRLGVRDGKFLTVTEVSPSDVVPGDVRGAGVVCEFERCAPLSREESLEHVAENLWPDARASVEGRLVSDVAKNGNLVRYAESFVGLRRETSFDLTEYLETRKLAGATPVRILQELPFSDGRLEMVSVGERLFPVPPRSHTPPTVDGSVYEEDAERSIQFALRDHFPMLDTQTGVVRLFRGVESENPYGFRVRMWRCRLPMARMLVHFPKIPDLVQDALDEAAAYQKIAADDAEEDDWKEVP